MYLLEELKCPYCNNLLSLTPKRKTKCKNCGNYFHVKTKPSDRTKVIVTEQESNNIEKEWSDYWASKRVFSAEFVSGGRISDEEFQEAKNIVISQGKNIPDNDIVWGLFNRKITLLIKENNWSEMGSVYYGMAMFLQREGKDCFRVLQESTKCKLMEFKEEGVTSVEICGTDNSCEKCRQLNGKQLDIETALKDMPIPVRECSTEVFADDKGFCRCLYLAK